MSRVEEVRSETRPVVPGRTQVASEAPHLTTERRTTGASPTGRDRTLGTRSEGHGSVERCWVAIRPSGGFYCRVGRGAIFPRTDRENGDQSGVFPG